MPNRKLFFASPLPETEVLSIAGLRIPKYAGEFWTSKQRQSSSLHEISYRACFKAQLPRFFIQTLTNEGEVVYDPFSGRGTTILEGALLGRNVAANDVNPLSEILSRPRLTPPTLPAIAARLAAIDLNRNLRAEIDLSMFYHRETEGELVSLKTYFSRRRHRGEEDDIDRWIRMIATNRLTGHSGGFFSVYTLPPNQAVTADRQRKINVRLDQQPPRRDVAAIILRKSKTLLRNVTAEDSARLAEAAQRARFLTSDARATPGLADASVDLTVTSPPFLDVVNYAQDNWLRCWFNELPEETIGKNITMSRTLDDWCDVMLGVFRELARVTKTGGWVAFEVGEVRHSSIRLDEAVIPLGLRSGFVCEGVVVNTQQFTKTSNIWGISNNAKGTNSNRIVLFRKPE